MIRKTITLKESQYGHPQPTITLESIPWYDEHQQQTVNHRVVASEVYSVAARVELASIGRENQWVVCVNTNMCQIHLELFKGTQEEVDRAMKALGSAVG